MARLMPVKRSITWADIQVGEIRRISQKKDSDFDAQDKLNRDMAVLIASFSSCHSWQTRRHIMERANGFNSPEVKEEYNQAKANRWKQVSVFDIGELAREPIPDNMFSEWLFFSVDKKEHKSYRETWETLQAKLADYLDEVAKREED